ncbi:MAG: hypothetical protein AAGF67_01130 [Verrucomicrobiota bacterium]
MLQLLFVSSLLSFLAADSWKELNFREIDPNKTTYGPGKLRVEVNGSASPLIHLFSERKNVSSLRITGRVAGNWKFATGDDWANSPDDALLRIGLIENGTRRLNPLEKLAAPEWITEIEEATRSTADGVGTIRCFHLMPNENWVGQTRTNPNAKLFHETVAATPAEDGSFAIEVELDSPLESVGLWLLADGDDSGVAFIVEIDSLEVNMAP